MTATPSAYSPMKKAPIEAIAMRNASSSSCPRKMPRIARQKTENPVTAKAIPKTIGVAMG